MEMLMVSASCHFRGLLHWEYFFCHIPCIPVNNGSSNFALDGKDQTTFPVGLARCYKPGTACMMSQCAQVVIGAQMRMHSIGACSWTTNFILLTTYRLKLAFRTISLTSHMKIITSAAAFIKLYWYISPTN